MEPINRKSAIYAIQSIIAIMEQNGIVELDSGTFKPMFDNVLKALKLPEGAKPYGKQIVFEGGKEPFRRKRLYEKISDQLEGAGLLDIDIAEADDGRVICNWRIKAVKWDD